MGFLPLVAFINHLFVFWKEDFSWQNAGCSRNVKVTDGKGLHVSDNWHFTNHLLLCQCFVRFSDSFKGNKSITSSSVTFYLGQTLSGFPYDSSLEYSTSWLAAMVWLLKNIKYKCGSWLLVHSHPPVYHASIILKQKQTVFSAFYDILLQNIDTMSHSSDWHMFMHIQTHACAKTRSLQAVSHL